MKQGKTLQELALEIKRQSEVKKDYLADTRVLEMVPSENGMDMRINGTDNTFLIGETAHGQLAQYTEIPNRYYEKMMYRSPELLAENVNHWLQSSDGTSRMLRTLDGGLRAFLSERYRRIDNEQVAEAVLPIIGNMPGAQVKSCEITERRLYIKVVNPRIQAEVTKGDIVQSGLMISNSEIGLGRVSVVPLIYRLVCTNGMIAADNSLAAIRKNHIGRTNESNEDYTVYRDETIIAEEKAFVMKLQDSVQAAMDEAQFIQMSEMMRSTKEAKIESKTVPKVVELTAKRVGITQYESSGVLGHLIEGGDLSLYGLANAATRYAQDVSCYDRSTELEAIGYKILTIAPKIWKGILSEARKAV